jgi:hypothetical protein
MSDRFFERPILNSPYAYPSKHWELDSPFFCQIEAVETALWLTEVAPKVGARGTKFWEHLRNRDVLR